MTLNEYILILGSNIDRENNITRACRLIENMAVIEKKSAVFETPSIKKGLPAFLDQAIVVKTALDLSTIKTELLAIEKQLGRVRTSDAFASRTIDIDIMVHNGSWLVDSKKDLNYPQIVKPLMDLDTGLAYGDGQSLYDHFTSLEKTDIRRLRSDRRTVLVTGSAKRVGRALAIAFAKEGFDLILHYNHSKNEVKQVQKIIEQYGQKGHLWQSDLGNRDLDVSIIKEQKIDLLINSAASFYDDQVVDNDRRIKEKQWHINFMSPLKLIEQYIHSQKCGHVINILDNAITRNDSPHNHYMMTKKLLGDITKQKAAQHRPQFRVNAIAPGWIMDPVGSNRSHEENKRIIEKKALPRKGDTADLVDTSLFLHKNDYVNGQVIFLDGGRHLS